MPTSGDDGYPAGKGQQLDERADSFQAARQGRVGTGRPSSAGTPASLSPPLLGPGAVRGPPRRFGQGP